MKRLSDKDIKDDLIDALAARCASSFADSLISGGEDVEEEAPTSLILSSVMSGLDLVTLLFTDLKGRFAARITLSGNDARRALEHPRSMISAAKNYKASRLTLCVCSAMGRLDGKTAFSAADFLSAQKKTCLSGFVYVGKDYVYWYKRKKTGASGRRK